MYKAQNSKMVRTFHSLVVVQHTDKPDLPLPQPSGFVDSTVSRCTR
jgi:hypothetical protein